MSRHETALRVSTTGGTMHLAGELDSSSIGRFDDALAEVDGHSVRFDLAGLSSIDAAGLTSLLFNIEAERANGRAAWIAAMSEPVRRALEETGLVEHLTGR